LPLRKKQCFQSLAGSVVRWLRKQLGLGIVDGDDGGAFRALRLLPQ
jgi:hypothetical protein